MGLVSMASRADLRYCLPSVSWLSCLAAVLLVRARARTGNWVDALIAGSLLPGLGLVGASLFLRVPVLVGAVDKDKFLADHGPQAAYVFLAKKLEQGKFQGVVLLLGRLGFRCPADYRSAPILPPQQVPILSHSGSVSYLVVDVRDPTQFRLVVTEIARAHPNQRMDMNELARQAPLATLDRNTLMRSLPQNGYFIDSEGRVILPAPLRRPSPFSILGAAALYGTVVFNQDGVSVIIPPPLGDPDDGDSAKDVKKGPGFYPGP